MGQVSGESVSTGTRTRKMKTVTRPCGRKPFGYPFGGSTIDNDDDREKEKFEGDSGRC